MNINTIIAAVALVTALCAVGYSWTQSNRINDLETALAETATPAVSTSVQANVGEAQDVETAVRRTPSKGPVGSLARQERQLELAKEKQALSEKIDAAMSEPETEESRERLRKVIAEERQILEDERWQKRAAKREERMRERISEFSAKHALSKDQEVQITDWLSEEQAELTDLFRKAREDFTVPEAREKALELRGETDEKVADLIDEDAFADFKADRAEEAQRFNRCRRGPRRDAPRETAKSKER